MDFGPAVSGLGQVRGWIRGWVRGFGGSWVRFGGSWVRGRVRRFLGLWVRGFVRRSRAPWAPIDAEKAFSQLTLLGRVDRH